MKISVAMAVYNGERFIEEQLNSIVNQTVKPDEIVVSDDGSNDKTLKIVSHIADINPQIRFIILTDNTIHGFCHNFEHAIAGCSGDLIVLSDQDDVWRPDKIEHTIAFFNNHSDALLMFHDAEMIDEKGNHLNGRIDYDVKDEVLRLYKNVCPVKLKRDDFLVMSHSCISVHGMVMSFRREILKTAFPFPPGVFAHDYWLLFCAVASDGCWYLNNKLAAYRSYGKSLTKLACKHDGIKDWILKLKIDGCFSALYENYIIRYEQKIMLLAGCSDNDLYRNSFFRELVGEVYHKANISGRIEGIKILKNLYENNNIYGQIGKKQYYTDCFRILLHKKSKRESKISEFFKKLDAANVGNELLYILR